jgi:hypothetical protein
MQEIWERRRGRRCVVAFKKDWAVGFVRGGWGMRGGRCMAGMLRERDEGGENGDGSRGWRMLVSRGRCSVMRYWAERWECACGLLRAWYVGAFTMGVSTVFGVGLNGSSHHCAEYMIFGVCLVGAILSSCSYHVGVGDGVRVSSSWFGQRTRQGQTLYCV